MAASIVAKVAGTPRWSARSPSAPTADSRRTKLIAVGASHTCSRVPFLGPIWISRLPLHRSRSIPSSAAREIASARNGGSDVLARTEIDRVEKREQLLD